MVNVPDPRYWKPHNDRGDILYTCKLCHLPPCKAFNCKAHEKSQAHQTAVEAANRRPPLPSPNHLHPTFVVHNTLRALLVSGSSRPQQPLYPAGHVYGEPNFPQAPLPNESPATGINWLNLEAFEDTQAELSQEERNRAHLFDISVDVMNMDSDVDFGEGLQRSDSEISDGDNEHSVHEPEDQRQKRARAGDTDPALAHEWYPWPDRVSCTLDILMHLPRSAFSHKQMDLFVWLLRINRVDDVPSTKASKAINLSLQNLCGIDTLDYDGKMGHPYHVNSLSNILAQEMCNPKVRPHLYFYPEDSGERLEEARQGSCWLEELSPEEATPMIRLGKDDYYIFEPTMLLDGSVCIPFRWFTRNGSFFAKAWGLETLNDGWIVCKNIELEISQDKLLKNIVHLSNDHKKYNIPHPSMISGIRPKGPACANLEPWKHTNPVLGNRWRLLAKGHRTLSVPLWMYCDDTSGNQSKKWNEHNSFLFTLAGLPREHVAKEYNIHFLSTSNLAPPLEMMDGVVTQIEESQKNGIWAWDLIHKEPVLLIPSVLALLGDNPMHSEFACHIGLSGKYFCRACWVKASDSQDTGNDKALHSSILTPNNSPAQQPTTTADDRSSVDSDVVPIELTPATSTAALIPPSVPIALTPITTLIPPSAPTKTRSKYLESMDVMVNRIRSFMKIGRPRVKHETVNTLASFYAEAKTIGAKTRLKLRRTETGIKDTMQEHFLDKLYAAQKNVEGQTAKQDAVTATFENFPSDITSPVWRLGLDPHRDTPVEILHVVLLGFVKYFWHDVVQNQVNDEQKKTLIIRLNSVNVQGLGISKLNGRTLVTYAGSLTGCDFRAIAQVAPFVIYDMVPPDVYDAWVALSTLVPLIWQPTIANIDEFCVTLKKEIQNFLLKTARWNCSWFNKSKFHIILHLPEHIRRFGPAILFATEAFESFNAVIRAKSIHSNRLAPSRDIALAFAQANRVRHLLSGGLFLSPELVPAWKEDPKSIFASKWRSPGPGPMRLFDEDPTPASYLGLMSKPQSRAGECKTDKSEPQPWPHTLTGMRILATFSGMGRDALFVTNSEVILQNEDKCSIGEYVIIQSRGEVPSIACIREIIQVHGSPNFKINQADGILVQTALSVPANSPSEPLTMPRLFLLDKWAFVQYSDIQCTVNTQHDCRLHQCNTTGLRYTYQERVLTNQTTSMVEHLRRPDDRILNTAQMRDANFLQHFRIASTPLDEEVIIHESVRRAIDKRKAEAAGATTRAKAPGRGRGQATPVSSSLQQVLLTAGIGRGLGQALPVASSCGLQPQVLLSAGSRGRGKGQGQGRGTEPPP